MPRKPDNNDLQKRIESLQKEVIRHRKREEAFWRIQERLVQIIESIPIPLFVIDNNHIVTHYNRAMENLTGVDADEMIGTRDPWKALYSSARPTMADFILDGGPGEELTRYYQDTFRKSLVKAGVYEVEDFFPDIGDDGRWLFFTAAALTDSEGNVSGALETLQDTTERRRAIQEFFLRGAAYDDSATQRRVKEVRFFVDELVAGKVIKTGKPIIMNDISGDSEIHVERDKKLGYRTRNLLLVPLRSHERVIGTLSAINKKEGGFDQSDVELLSMLAGTVALSIENAIENTPDEGKIEVVVKPAGEGTLLAVRDYGVGITRENQTRIFEGFFATQETMNYSSKNPFDFNAGGKGADLLRMKIFSERYGFKIELTSSRCRLIPKDADTCPGRISQCPRCQKGRTCHQTVATIFSLYFPPPASSP